jgi:hypothetical protein
MSPTILPLPLLAYARNGKEHCETGKKKWLKNNN